MLNVSKCDDKSVFVITVENDKSYQNKQVWLSKCSF